MPEKSDITKKPTDTSSTEDLHYLSKYKLEYCEKLVKFFTVEPYTTVAGKVGKIVLVPNKLPLISKFASDIGVTTTTIKRWVKNFSEFEEAYKKAKDLQEYILVTNTLMGLYDSSAAKFAMKNKLGWKDTADIDVEGEVNVIHSLLNKVSQKSEDKSFLDE